MMRFMRLPNGRIRKLRQSSDDWAAAHSLAFSCFRRQRFLAQERRRLWLVEAIEAARCKHSFNLFRGYGRRAAAARYGFDPGTAGTLAVLELRVGRTEEGKQEACYAGYRESMPPAGVSANDEVFVFH